MLKMDINRNITLEQGDTTNIQLKIDDYKLQIGDKICFIVYNNDEIVYKESITTFENGIGFLKLTEDKTRAIKVGNYKYSVRVIIPTLKYSNTLVNNKNFIVERGFVCND